MPANRTPSLSSQFLLIALAALALVLAAPAAGLAKGKAGAFRSAGHIDISHQRALGAASSCKAARASSARASSAQRRLLRRIAKRCNPAAPVSAPVSLYWGALVGDQLTGDKPPWDMGALDKFESMAGKSASLVHFMAPFAQCSSSDCSYYKFPAKEMEGIRNQGAIPSSAGARSRSRPASTSRTSSSPT